MTTPPIDKYQQEFFRSEIALIIRAELGIFEARLTDFMSDNFCDIGEALAHLTVRVENTGRQAVNRRERKTKA